MSRTSRFIGLLASVVMVAVVGLLAAGPAAAHAQLLSTAPVAGATVAQAPAAVTLTFDEAPLIKFTVVHVTAPDGKRVDSGPATLSGVVVSERVANITAPGKYVVDWRAVSDDGHPVSGQFSFSLSRTTSGAASPSPSAASSAAVAATTPSASATPVAGAPTKASRSQSPPVIAIVVIAALLVLALGFAIYAFQRRRAAVQK